MTQHLIKRFNISNTKPMALIAGPCVIESEELVMQCAEKLQAMTTQLDMPFIFKSSLDKANRTKGSSFRGPGLEEGLRILEKVRKNFGVPVITDIHDSDMITAVQEVVDVLQVPAFLCRQTDLLVKAAATGLPVNIKKGQFMAPQDMRYVLEKATSTGNQDIMLCERGATFGYHNLVVDYRGLHVMKEFGNPVIFDATHSVQLPGGLDGRSGGERKYATILAKASLTVGIAGIFAETHPNPGQALCDGPNAIPLSAMPQVLAQWQAIDQLAKSHAMAEVEMG